MGEITLFYLTKQTIANPHKSNRSRAVLSQHSTVGPVCFCAGRGGGASDSLHPTRSGKALCLPHAGDHSNLTAEANESHSWGWDVFVCFSSRESPAGFFIQVLGKKNTGGSWFPGSKTITKKFYPGATFKNTMYTVGRKQGAVSKNF